MRDGAVDGLFDAVYFCFSGGAGLVGEMMGRQREEEGRQGGKEVERGGRPGVLSYYPLRRILYTLE